MSKKIIKPVNSSCKRKIVGRGSGSKKGGTSGKGHKGYNARSGTAGFLVFEGGQMPVVRKMPKVGFSNYPFKKKYQIVKIGEIEKKFQEGEEINTDTLKKKRLIGSRHKPVKIVGGGNLKKKVTFDTKIVFTQSVAKIVSEFVGIAQHK